MDIGGAIGRVAGVLLAPAAALGGFLRGARLFHPDGAVYRTDVHADVTEGALGELAQRIAGPGLARLSSALWRQKPEATPRDILGVALRFNTPPVAVPGPRSRAQDLLLASFQYTWQLPFGMLVTNQRDFLANDYYAVLPFRVDGLGVVKFRIVPEADAEAEAAEAGEDMSPLARLARLERAVRQGRAVFRLQVKRAKRGAAWTPLATVVLRERVDIDQAALRFTPFHAGAGIEPVGFIQGLRWAAYAGSQVGRQVLRRRGRGG